MRPTVTEDENDMANNAAARPLPFPSGDDVAHNTVKKHRGPNRRCRFHRWGPPTGVRLRGKSPAWRWTFRCQDCREVRRVVSPTPPHHQGLGYSENLPAEWEWTPPEIKPTLGKHGTHLLTCECTDCRWERFKRETLVFED